MEESHLMRNNEFISQASKASGAPKEIGRANAISPKKTTLLWWEWLNMAEKELVIFIIIYIFKILICTCIHQSICEKTGSQNTSRVYFMEM